MPIVPMKQTVTITPATGVMDDFNRLQYGTPVSVKCRFQETITLVTSIASGKEAVSKATIFFDGLIDIDEKTRIEYTNENGVTVTRSPLSIAVKRHINGKPILTVVYV